LKYVYSYPVAIINVGENMIEQDLTEKSWEELTSREISERFGLTKREVDVLRKRFGIVDKSEDNSPVPPEDGEDNGSGGVPAPAKPPN